MKLIDKTLLILCLSIFYINTAVSSSKPIIPNSMQVITSDDKPLSNIAYAQILLNRRTTSLTIYNLDALTQFTQQLSTNLPKGEKQAQRALQEQIKKIGQSQFKQQALHASEPIMVAFKHQIKRYPAIIFDENSVIYGLTDLKLALHQYSQWQQAKQGEHNE